MIGWLLRALVLLFLVSGVSWADIASLGCTTHNQGVGSSTSFSHTTPSGSDRLLIVGIGHHTTSDAISSVTYDGVAMTRTHLNFRSEIWYMVAPPTGAHTVAISRSGVWSQIRVAACSFTGVDQSTPLGTPVGGSGVSPTNQPSVNVSSATGELVFDNLIVTSSGGLGITVGPGQTQLFNHGTIHGGSIEPGSGTVTMSWTNASSAGNDWNMSAVPIKPAAGGGGVGPVQFFRRRVK